MNIDRMIPKAIRETPHPVEDMLESLEEFADTIGGPAWRQRRAVATSMSRSITLYFDEDYELFPPVDRPDYSEGENEEVEVSFTAFREPNEETGELFNVYKLSHEVSLPLGTRSDDIPEPFASQLVAAVAADTADRQEALRTSGESTDNEEEERQVFVETNMVEYTISAEDGEISYLQTIEYRNGDIPVSGASYDSELEVQYVHGEEDNHAEEITLPKNNITEDSINNVGERILIAHDMGVIVTHPTMQCEVVGQSREENARRILGLLSLIGCNIRRYRPEYEE